MIGKYEGLCILSVGTVVIIACAAWLRRDLQAELDFVKGELGCMCGIFLEYTTPSSIEVSLAHPVLGVPSYTRETHNHFLDSQEAIMDKMDCHAEEYYG